MPIDLEQIDAIRTQTLVQMENLLSTTGHTIAVGDDETPWAPLLAALERTVDWCDRKLAEYDPYEVRSRGKT